MSRVHGSTGFGVVPSVDAAANRPRFVEICELLGRATGTPFHPYFGASYRDMLSALSQDDAGLAWVPPLLALEGMEKKLASPLVVPVRRGSTSYYSAILVRPGGPTLLTGLRGCTIAWVDRDSVTGYQLPRAHLASLGMDPDDMFPRELFLKTHEAAVDALVSGRADVCATYCTVEPGSRRSVQGAWTSPDGSSSRPVEVLTTLGPIPNDGLVVSDRMPREAQTSLLRFLLAPDPRTRELFKLTMRAESFHAATPAHYAHLRRLVTPRTTIRPPA